MPLALTLRLDDAGSARVAAMQPTPMPYPPHVTLGVFDDGVDIEAARAAAAGWRSLRVRLAGFGVFAGDQAVLWLVVTPTRLLLDIHVQLSVLGGMQADYQVDAWVPHVTLASDLTNARATEAIRALSSQWVPFEVELDRVELVRFPPVRILWSQQLR